MHCPRTEHCYGQRRANVIGSFGPMVKAPHRGHRQQSDIRRLADLRLSELNAAWPEVGALRVLLSSLF